jgi:multidrug efflux pump subunit AcrB
LGLCSSFDKFRLIVEFAKEKSAHGATPRDATIEACRLRLRPIIMTSLAFILGVVPLALAVGAGAEMRRPLGSPSSPACWA